MKYMYALLVCVSISSVFAADEPLDLHAALAYLLMEDRGEIAANDNSMWNVQDDGDGPYIKTWHHKWWPKPTTTRILAVKAKANAWWSGFVATNRAAFAYTNLLPTIKLINMDKPEGKKIDKAKFIEEYLKK